MLYLVVIFIGAFLLFQVQPLIAKLILPYFGGGAAVWTACMLFFQGFLLLGYGYAHILSQLKNYNHRLIIHSILLIICALLMPISLVPIDLISDTEPLTQVLVMLSLSVGLPYFLLSATGPLVQKFYLLNHNNSQPYFLYSWSNAASLLALLSFPFLIEPTLASSIQLKTWSIGFVIYTLAMLAILWRSRVTKSQIIDKQEQSSIQQENETKDEAISFTRRIYWLIFSALGVITLVATTSAITQNVTPIPFLWILPLCLYLLTFIICFHSVKWYVRWYWLALLVLSAFIAIFMHFIGSQFDLITQVILFSAVLFCACMVCHGELALNKPSAERLTDFYLTLSLGGFLGSLFVALVASQIFDQFLEFPLAFISLLFVLAAFLYKEFNRITFPVVSCAVSGVLLIVLFNYLNVNYQKNDIYQARNFYGVLSVKDIEINGEKERRLIDGTTSHGTQYLAKEKQHLALSYYRKNTGGALAIELLQQQGSVNTAFVGLGAGALAAYGKVDDNFDFYELNPAVISAAQQYFTFLADSAANINIVQGDARVSLNQLLNKPHKKYDLLVLDAFSGDSIPQHLLTVEAIMLYQELLIEEGTIAIHISNSHLNLLPLMQGLAENAGYSLVYFRTQAKKPGEHDTDWVWLTKNKALLSKSKAKIYQTAISDNARIIWTDDYSYLSTLLK